MNASNWYSYGQRWQTPDTHTGQDQLSVHTPAGKSLYSEVVIPLEQQYMLPLFPEHEDAERDSAILKEDPAFTPSALVGYLTSTRPTESR